ncbi:hypothetical protein Hanom_Chr04g00320511 [Helianthus anomalus]
MPLFTNIKTNRNKQSLIQPTIPYSNLSLTSVTVIPSSPSHTLRPAVAPSSSPSCFRLETITFVHHHQSMLFILVQIYSFYPLAPLRFSDDPLPSDSDMRLGVCRVGGGNPSLSRFSDGPRN